MHINSFLIVALLNDLLRPLCYNRLRHLVLLDLSINMFLALSLHLENAPRYLLYLVLSFMLSQLETVVADDS